MTVGVEKEDGLLKARRKFPEWFGEGGKPVIDRSSNLPLPDRVCLGAYDGSADLDFMLCELGFDPSDVFAEASCPLLFVVDSTCGQVDANDQNALSHEGEILRDDVSHALSSS